MLALSVAAWVPSSTMGHVSWSPPKIPYGGFSPVRLQDSAGSCIGGALRRRYDFDAVLVRSRRSVVTPVGLAACRDDLRFVRTALSHGPLAPRGFCCPSPRRYYGPIRQSRCHPLPRCSAACAPSSRATRPSQLSDADHSLGAATPAPEETTAALVRYLRRCPSAFARGRGLGFPRFPHPLFRGDVLTTLQCSLSAAAPRFACPPGGPGHLTTAARTFT